MSLEILNKKINSRYIEKIYGTESIKKLTQIIINENTEKLDSIKKINIFKEIKEKTDKEVDLVSTLLNYFIETELKNYVIVSLNNEVLEKDVEIKHLIKENNNLLYRLSI